jgi:FtsP/CotA-like multicopper oxidase with cupredoxin domain
MINRREFLKITSTGAVGVFTGGVTSLLNLPFAVAETNTASEFIPDLDIALTAAPDEISLFPGNPTGVWSFRGKVLQGDNKHLINLERSYLGPIIRVNRGQKIRIRFTNDIPDETIVHWHGLHVPAVMDGHPRFVIPQGETYIYEFEVRNRAGTYWYHPHPHGRTGPQVYGGMAGLFIVWVIG